MLLSWALDKLVNNPFKWPIDHLAVQFQEHLCVLNRRRPDQQAGEQFSVSFDAFCMHNLFISPPPPPPTPHPI